MNKDCSFFSSSRDGMISKSEMRSYFLRAKYHDLKGEFKHDFHETTYFKPTFCVHCTGLLWGLIKQGWKCKGKLSIPAPSSLHRYTNLDCGINAHRHCKDQVVMECRQKRPNPVNKQGSVSDSRPSRSSFRIRKTRKQKGTQTEDINFSSSSTSTSASSESCTSSSEDEQQLTTNDKLSNSRQQWHSYKPSSLKHRKPVLSDSNDEYYYTHPPSPQQQITTTNNSTNTNTNLPNNVIPIAQQLIPRGPLICSDSFEKWNDRCFTWNRPSQPPTSLSSAPSTSTGTSESTISITTTTTKTELPNDEDKHQVEPMYGQASFFEGDVSDDDDDTTHFVEPNKTRRTVKTVTCKDIGLTTSPMLDPEDETHVTNEMNIPIIKTPSTTNFGSSQNLNVRKLSLTDSLRSLPANADTSQSEIFERLRQAEQVSHCLSYLLIYFVC